MSAMCPLHCLECSALKWFLYMPHPHSAHVRCLSSSEASATLQMVDPAATLDTDNSCWYTIPKVYQMLIAAYVVLCANKRYLSFHTAS
jgi:hypothetical protein